MEAVDNADHLYEVERKVRYAERPGFRISEIQISPSQFVPWHYHTRIADTFYVIEGSIKLLLHDPVQEVILKVAETYAVPARRPHRVENAGSTSATFLVLQGVGEYDYVPLDL